MKILMVIDDYFNTTNGMAISTQRFAKQLRQLGHEVRILSTSSNDNKVDYPVPRIKPVLFSNLISQQGYIFGKPVDSTIQKAVQWADIVHLDTPFFLGARAGSIAKKYGKTVTGTFHLYPENMTASVPIFDRPLINDQLMRLFRDWSFKTCTSIQCPTLKVKERLIKYNFPQKLTVISNGISTPFLKNSHISNPNHPFTVLCIGRYSNEKDQETLFKAMKQVHNSKNMQLILAGKGPLEGKYAQLAQEISSKVIMKYYPPHELQQLTRNADLVVHCANVEVEGMSCMEAFASGCVPIIADSPLSSTVSYALTEYNKFPAGDEISLAKRIDYWYTHTQQLEDNRQKYVNYAKTLTVKKSAEKVAVMMQDALNQNKKE